MKFLNRILFLSLVMLLTNIALQAQPKWVAKKAQATADEVSAALGLSEAQAKQVYDIQLASNVKSSELQESFKAESITLEEKQAQNRALKKENTAQIVEVLGADLGAKYKELFGGKKKGPKGKKQAVKAPKDKVAKKGKGKKGDWQTQKARKLTDEVAAALELDEAQTQTVYDIQLATNLESKKINEAFKAGSITKEEQKAQAKEVRKAGTAQIIEALGSDLGKQYKQFLKAQREAKMK